MASQFHRLFSNLPFIVRIPFAAGTRFASGGSGGIVQRVCSVGSLSIVLASGIVQAQVLPVAEGDREASEDSALWSQIPAPTPEMLAADRALALSRGTSESLTQTASSLTVSALVSNGAEPTRAASEAAVSETIDETVTEQAGGHEAALAGLTPSELTPSELAPSEPTEQRQGLSEVQAKLDVELDTESVDTESVSVAAQKPEQVMAAVSVPPQRYRSVLTGNQSDQDTPLQSDSADDFQASETSLIEQLSSSQASSSQASGPQVLNSDADVSEAVTAAPAAASTPASLHRTPDFKAPASVQAVSSVANKPQLRLRQAAKPVPTPSTLALPAPPVADSAAPTLLAGTNLQGALGRASTAQTPGGQSALAPSQLASAASGLPQLVPAAYPGQGSSEYGYSATSYASSSGEQVVSQALPPVPGYGSSGYSSPPGYGQPLAPQNYALPSVPPGSYIQPGYAQPGYVQPASPFYGAPPPGYGAPIVAPAAYPAMPSPYYVMYAPTGVPMVPAAPGYPMAAYPAPGYSTPAYPTPGYPAPYPTVGYSAPVAPAPGYPVASYPTNYPAPGYPAPSYSAPSYPAPGYPAPGYPVAGYPAAGPTPGYPAPGYAPSPLPPSLPYSPIPAPGGIAPGGIGNVATTPGAPLLLPPPPAPGAYGGNYGVAGGVPSNAAPTVATPNYSNPGYGDPGYASVPAPPALTTAPSGVVLGGGASSGELPPTVVPQQPASASAQSIPIRTQPAPSTPVLNPGLTQPAQPTQPPLNPEPVLATPPGELPNAETLPGSAVGGPLDSPVPMQPMQVVPGVTPLPVPEVREEASLPQFRDGQLLRTNALAGPNYSMQGVFVAEGSDTAARARLSGTYPLTSNILFGGAFDVSSGDSFSVGETDGFSVNELYAAASLDQLPNLRFAVGQLDLTSYFDRNSFAKDSSTHFFNSAFQTNPALSAAGVSSRTGLLLNWTATDNIELKAAAFSSDEDLAGFALDGFAGEVGVRYGNAIIRGSYASDKDSGNDDGFQEIFSTPRPGGGTGLRSGDREQAYGVNAEWYVPNLKMGLFGRYGRYENLDLDEGGDTFSLGFNFQDVFSQDDRLGMAYGRNLSNESLRRKLEFDPAPDVLELFYDFRFLPNLRLGFSLQGRDEFSEAVAGFRLKAEFDPVPRGNLTERFRYNNLTER